MKSNKRQISFLSREEVQKIIDTCEDTGKGRRDRALLEVLFSTGLRISECLNLKREDFNQVDSNKIKDLTVVGKGGYQRVIYFSPRALSAIESYLKARNDTNSLLFPRTARAVQYMTKQRALMAGIIKRVSCHVFRHSLATDLLRQGVDIRFVQKFLGHRSLNNTMLYTHVVDDQLKKIHEKLYK